MRLTQKQETFALAVFEGRSASDAYRFAYDAERMLPATIHRNAAALLDNNRIAARLAALRADAEQRSQVTVERTLRELAAIGFGEERDAVKLRALELIGKHLGMFREGEAASEERHLHLHLWSDDDLRAAARWLGEG